MINDTKLKNILPHNLIQEKAGGERPFYWVAVMSHVDQNYQEAYFNYASDKVFLLDVEQLKRYVHDQGLSVVKRGDSGTKVEYWLRTPYYSNTNMTRMVGRDGFVYHKHANFEVCRCSPGYIY